MLKALLAGLVGGLFLLLTSLTPGVNLMNVCCGFWFLSGGLIAAYTWSRLNGGRGSLFFGLLSGLLAGISYTGVSVVGTGLMVGGYATMLGEQVAQVELIQSYPEQGLTAEQWLDFAEQALEQSESMSASEREMRLSELERGRRKLAEIRSDPTQNANLEQGLEKIHEFLISIKRGEFEIFVQIAVLVVFLIGLLATALAALGGFLGGLIFGGSPPPQPTQGQPVGPQAAAA